MIAIIVAKSSNGVIGSNNDLPWYLPADLRHFKKITDGHTVIMGRKTFDSIYSRLRAPLPNRRNIVISRSLAKLPSGFELAKSFDAALEQVEEGETYIIGGATIYAAALEKNIIDRIYITEIFNDISGDTYFPELDAKDWQELSCEHHLSDDKNEYDYNFVTLDRKQ